MRTDGGSLSETLVWVLAHSLWQGAFLAGAVWLALRWLPARHADRRYGAATLGLAAVVMSSLVTWSLLRLDRVARSPLEIATESAPSFLPAGQQGRTGLLEAEPLPVYSSSVTSDGATGSAGGTAPARDWTVWLAALWSVGAGVMLARSLLGIAQAQGFAAGQGSLAAHDLSELNALVSELSERLGLRRIAPLVVSARIRTPAVLGTLWPCVLIPAAMLSGVPADQWRIILAHELAHIRRHDALVNLAQMLIESLLFFNPAVWWLSRQIRVEREACCDALAASVAGEPALVARALVEAAATLQADACRRGAGDDEETSVWMSESLVAFAKCGHAGELTDRVHRLVDPDQPPKPRVTRRGLIGVTLGLLLAGAILQQGTDLAVRAAAQLMSPKERVDRIARLQAETNGIFLPEATSPAPKDAARPDADGASTTDPREKQKVTLVVRTEDGSPVPRQTQVASAWRAGNSSAGSSEDGPREEAPEFRKTYTFRPGRVRIGIVSKGFAPVNSPIVSLFAGDPERTIELVLKRGKQATFRITDQQQRPIANAEVQLSARISIDQSAIGLESRSLRTDDRGLATFENIGESDYTQAVRAAGFRRDERAGVINISEPIEWKLQPARPTPVKVVDAASGAPVVQARIELVRWKRSNHSSSYGDPRNRSASGWNTYAETGTNGVAVLDELRDDTSYMFGVLAPGYAMAALEGVQAGQRERIIKLFPPLTLAGRVVGPLNRLPELRSSNKVQRYFQCVTRLADHVSGSRRISVDGDGRFEIPNLAPGEQVTLELPDERQEFVMKQSRKDVELKFGEQTAAMDVPEREVVIRLTGAAPEAPVRGTLYVSWMHPKSVKFQNGPLPVVNNEIRMNIPIGGLLNFHPQNLAGYTIERQDQVEIVGGAGPQMVEAPARPAGAIYGTIVRADGSPATTAFVTVFATRLPPGEKDGRRLNPDSASASASFLAPLPLRGRYRVLARELTDSHNVWTLSDEVTLDETQPIQEIRLTLPEGRSVPVKIVGPDGRPVVGQPVQLNLNFSQSGGHSTGFNIDSQTGADGIAWFKNLAVDSPLAPLDVAYKLLVPSIRFQGWYDEIDPTRPPEIHLERGLSATGIVIEATSGKPIPDAEVRLVPAEFDRAKFKSAVTAKTNDQGEVRFQGLEDQAYNAYIDGTVPKGTVITPIGQGARYRYPNGVPPQPKLFAGSTIPARWEVLIPPGSSLRVAD